MRLFVRSIVTSGEFGVGKPDPSIYQRSLAELDADSHDWFMVGDSLENDVSGAAAIGPRPFWLNRPGTRRPDGHDGLLEIASLSSLPAALAAA